MILISIPAFCTGNCWEV